MAAPKNGAIFALAILLAVCCKCAFSSGSEDPGKKQIKMLQFKVHTLFKDQIDFDRERRVAYFYPQSFQRQFYASPFFGEDSEEDGELECRERFEI